ncbi:MAG: hypothetical protein J6V25_06530 [Oscillospiraceae bacterium]|nr:hypothetical protein [Oscillospiraceae bacterium]
MKRKMILSALSLMLIFSLVLTGCGSDKVPALKAGDELKLEEWTMNATTWSSPNGATVNLRAIPNGYAEGQSALFSVRLEGEEVASADCNWDGAVYTASVDLNAADGYCYFVVLTAVDGTVTEVAVNTPTAPADTSLINLATALHAYCEASVSESHLDGSKLVIDSGSVKIQLPWLTLDNGVVTCEQAVLILTHNGEAVSEEKIVIPEADENGVCLVDLSGMSFATPSGVEDDHQLGLRLDVTLSNGHTLTAPAGTWYYNNGNVVLAVG